MELFVASVFHLCILDLRPFPKIEICACSFPGVSVATCMAILHVGSAQQVRTGSTSSKEDDYESDAATIVQKCVSQVSGDMETLTVNMWECGFFSLWRKRLRVSTLLPCTVFLRWIQPRYFAYLHP